MVEVKVAEAVDHQTLARLQNNGVAQRLGIVGEGAEEFFHRLLEVAGHYYTLPQKTAHELMPSAVGPPACVLGRERVAEDYQLV